MGWALLPRLWIAVVLLVQGSSFPILNCTPKLGRIQWPSSLSSSSSSHVHGVHLYGQASNISSTCLYASASIDCIPPSETKMERVKRGMKGISTQWKASIVQFKANPLTFISIPVVAAIVGYVTNYVGVNMLFYPIEWTGIPIKKWIGQPLGLIGWQGIVPAKRWAMAGRMVDVTITKLLKIPEVFAVLEPRRMSQFLSPSIGKVIFGGYMPGSVVRYYLAVVSRKIIQSIESLISVRDIVIQGMTTDPRTLGRFFQTVGYRELQFLVSSGTYFGFLLGLLQMLQWMIYPRNWTLPIGGAVVGYITNWIALKLCFEPLNPTKIGPFVIQGLFLTRQKEVSEAFSTFIAANVLTSQEIWKSLLLGEHAVEFANIIRNNVPFLSNGAVATIMGTLKKQLLVNGAKNRHPMHLYINDKIDLRNTLIERMQRLTPAEFEQVLHPIFQEDEMTLIIAGGVLGALAGGAQWALNVHLEKRKAKENLLASSGTVEGGEGGAVEDGSVGSTLL